MTASAEPWSEVPAGGPGDAPCGARATPVAGRRPRQRGLSPAGIARGRVTAVRAGRGVCRGRRGAGARSRAANPLDGALVVRREAATAEPVTASADASAGETAAAAPARRGRRPSTASAHGHGSDDRSGRDRGAGSAQDTRPSLVGGIARPPATEAPSGTGRSAPAEAAEAAAPRKRTTRSKAAAEPSAESSAAASSADSAGGDTAATPRRRTTRRTAAAADTEG